jgi:hypothetical protein
MKEIVKIGVAAVALVILTIVASVIMPVRLPIARAESLQDNLLMAQGAPGKVTFTVKFNKDQVHGVRMKFEGDAGRPLFVKCESEKPIVVDTSKYKDATLDIMTKTGWRIENVIINGVKKLNYASTMIEDINKPGSPAKYEIEIIFCKG